jgi:hypothetical protein
LCHSPGFYSLSRSDILLFISQEAYSLGRHSASTAAHTRVPQLPRADGNRLDGQMTVLVCT